MRFFTFLALLSVGLLASPADAATKRPASYYPLLTVGDVAPCREQFIAAQNEFVKRQMADANMYRPGGSSWRANLNNEYSVSFYENAARKVAAQDPVEYGFGSSVLTNSLTPFNGPKRNEFIVDQIDYMLEPTENRTPDILSNDCVLRIWQKKFRAMHAGALRSDPGVAADFKRFRIVASDLTSRAPQSTALSPAASKPPAGLGSYADGGGYAKGGVSVSGSDQTGVSAVKSPKIGGKPPASGSPASRASMTAGGDDIFPVANMIGCVKYKYLGERVGQLEYQITNTCGEEISFSVNHIVNGKRKGYPFDGGVNPGQTIRFSGLTLAPNEKFHAVIVFGCPTVKSLAVRLKRKIAWAGWNPTARRCEGRFQIGAVNTAH